MKREDVEAEEKLARRQPRQPRPRAVIVATQRAPLARRRGARGARQQRLGRRRRTAALSAWPALLAVVVRARRIDRDHMLVPAAGAAAHSGTAGGSAAQLELGGVRLQLRVLELQLTELRARSLEGCAERAASRLRRRRHRRARRQRRRPCGRRGDRSGPARRRCRHQARCRRLLDRGRRPRRRRVSRRLRLLCLPRCRCRPLFSLLLAVTRLSHLLLEARDRMKIGVRGERDRREGGIGRETAGGEKSSTRLLLQGRHRRLQLSDPRLSRRRALLLALRRSRRRYPRRLRLLARGCRSALCLSLGLRLRRLSRRGYLTGGRLRRLRRLARRRQRVRLPGRRRVGRGLRRVGRGLRLLGA